MIDPRYFYMLLIVYMSYSKRISHMARDSL